MKTIDLTGKIFGTWTVIKRDLTKIGKGAYWHCICSCGFKASRDGRNLRRPETKSCRKCGQSARRSDACEPGKVFGKWTVLRRDIRKSRSICQCKCGTVSSILRSELISGRSKGCAKCRSGIDHQAMIGRVFYKWTVVEVVPPSMHGRALRTSYYKCQCRCGKTALLQRCDLINLATSQCVACERKQRRK